jgi:hypothetical protein
MALRLKQFKSSTGNVFYSQNTVHLLSLYVTRLEGLDKTLNRIILQMLA